MRSTRGPHQPRPAAPTTIDVVWNPIAALMGGGLAVRRGDRGFIVLDPSLVEPDRRAALLHELVHLERGCTDRQDAPRSWQAVTEREENAVEREVARRLVPRAALVQHVRRAATLDEPVTITGVAAEFEVPERVAHNALASLRDAEGGR